MRQIVSLALLLYLPFSRAMAQNMNDPYSMYGIGTIDSRPYNRTSGMGGTGQALSSSFYLVDNNPASLAGLTRSFYVIDAAGTGKLVSYAGNPITAANSNSRDFWIKRLSLAVKINNWWASGIGIRQFSNINYQFTGTKTEEGSGTGYAAVYQGDGGLNEYYWTHAAALGKHLSFGLKTSILAGAINQTETIADDGLQASIVTRQQDYMGQLHVKAGLIYTGRLSKKADWSFGASYAPRTRMLSERTLTVTENSTTIVSSSFLENNFFTLPDRVALGLSARFNNRSLFALDYSFDNWSALHLTQRSAVLVNSNRISAGADFSQIKKIGNLIGEKRHFQVGAFYGNSYLRISNMPIREYGFTTGMGGVLNAALMYNLALETGIRGTVQNNLIRENYIQLTIGLTFRDFLYSKGRKYD